MSFREDSLSIGCGCKTDALGLRQALRYCQNTVETTKYIGMDPGKWNDSEFFLHLNDDDEYIRLQDPEIENKTYVEQEIEYISSLKYREDIDKFSNGGEGQDSIYIIVFPNSISEINVNDLDKLLSSIHLAYQGKQLYLCLSRNTSFEWNPIDQDQVDKIQYFFHGCQPVINCSGGCEDGEERTEEEINNERSEALGVTIDNGKRLLDNLWYKYLTLEDRDENQMDLSCIQKALEVCPKQKREEIEKYIRDYIELHRKELQKGYKLPLLKQPLKDVNRFDCYQVYEVPEQ